LDDRVGAAEARDDFLVGGQLAKELSDRLVDLLIVLEIGQRPAPA
jgi:hypothetical protein